MMKPTAIILILASIAVAEDWPCFLGPSHNNVSSETKILKTFPASGPPLLWEYRKGEGYSAPAIASGKLVLLHRLGDNEIVDCLESSTGRQLWRFAYPTDYRDRYGNGDGPRCAPVIDANRVYTLGVEGKLHCLDLSAGTVIWKRDIVAEYKLPQNFFGVGATPLVEGDFLIVNVGAPEACVVAFDKSTGKVAWSTPSPWGPSYASPIPATVHNQRRIFVFAGGESRPCTGGLLCIDPKTGKSDFSFPWRAKRYESVNASSPLVIGSQVFISECYGPRGALLDIQPDFTVKTAWESTDLGTHFMTAIHKDGYLYGADGHGPRNCPLVCLDLKTGKETWRIEPKWDETVPGAEGPRNLHLSSSLCSMLLVEDKILCLGEFGHLAWIDPNPKQYTELSRASLFIAAQTWTNPVLSNGLLYICQNSRDSFHDKPPRLLCYDLRAR